MTAQILSSELSNLVQESKRKNSELRNAADKALQDLKSLPNTSESQLAADLSRRPHFVTPFLIACGTHNAKFAVSAVVCLQRLAVVRALPKERLNEVLEALKGCTTLGLDVQLKILQALPPLLQNYSSELRGDLLSSTLHVCSALQNAKNPAVSNTAAATLQQLVISVFDKVVAEDGKSLEIPTVAEVPGDGEPVSVRPAAHDAYKVFYDLNIMIDGGKPEHIQFQAISQISGLELIESVLSNHGSVISSHPEQGQILRAHLMPVVIRCLSDRLNFPQTLRIIRILNMVLRNHLSLMPSECEIVLGLLNHMLDPEASPPWKRALCLEIFRGIYLDPSLILQIYGQYDEEEGKKNIFRDNLAAFVRLATEKPAVIGLGNQSSIPTVRGEERDSASEQAVVEAGAISGVISGPLSGSHYTGISAQWSTTRTACMDQLDKTEPPALPDTYIYGLVLTCINNLSESLARFILPLTVYHEGRTKKRAKGEDDSNKEIDDESPGPANRRSSRTQSFRKRTVPLNPLTLTEHTTHSKVASTVSLINECWPAVLATCSTFLNAALDADYYHALVRSIQKFTQVAGLLRLATPRDAFITALGKAAVPPSVLMASVSGPMTPSPQTPRLGSNSKALLSVDSLVSQASSLALDRNRRSFDTTVQTLNTRNLLCLRALLHLAIALGPTLETAWSIVFETLQQADIVMAAAKNQGNLNRDARAPPASGRDPDGELSSQKLGSEISAVTSAVQRLFESTADFPNDSFVELLQALFKILQPAGTGSSTPNANNTARPSLLHQRRVGSVSGISLSTESLNQDSKFVLSKIGDLVTVNEGRLAQYEATESGWGMLVRELMRFCANSKADISARIFAAEIISRAVNSMAGASMEMEDQRSVIQARALSGLQSQISAIYDGSSHSNEGQTPDEDDLRVHLVALEALRSVIEQCGESLTAGWDTVFFVLSSAFDTSPDELGSDSREAHSQWSLPSVEIISKPLSRSAFGSVQLICSDFLTAVPDISLLKLLDLLARFCSQQEDLNMSLTTTTFFWNVSDFLHAKSDLSALPDLVDAHNRDARKRVEESCQQGSIPALWLQVLLYLSAVTTDARSEVRNGAVHTILRIFENYVDQLSSDAWILCLRAVLFRTVQANIAAQMTLRSKTDGTTKEETAAWNETTKITLKTISDLLSTYMATSSDLADFEDAWCTLLEYFEQYFAFGSHALGAPVFNVISAVFSKVENLHRIGKRALLQTASTWNTYFDHRDQWRQSAESNQDAFLAYAEAFKAIYRLTQGILEAETVLSMLSNLELCIVDSDKAAYSSDIDYMTPLQTQVLECLSLVQSDTPGAPSFLVKLLSRFIALPFTAAASKSDRPMPTFVALAKASMALLESILVRHIAENDIIESGAFYLALTSLARPISLKYTWQPEGKPPTLWQKATTTTLTILEPTIQQMKSQPPTSETAKPIWDQIILIAKGITSADLTSTPAPSSLLPDETFDIASFTKLKDLITTPLGSPSLPDSLRRTYTLNLFSASLIHAPWPGELPSLPDSSPLKDLYKIRLGRTKDPAPTPRQRIAYACLSELVSLVSAHTSTPHEIKMAQAAAPYLILRAALPLKAYIADQPLRGRMPQPESLRRELLGVLERMRGLECEPAAIPDVEGVRSEGRKHLIRLFPLVRRAVGVAGGDGEVFAGLMGLVEGVGEEFGL